MTPESIIKTLDLQPHPEGGYYKESFRSKFEVKNLDSNVRSALTSIYYLLEATQFSALHRIKSDEMWYFHAGEALELVAIDLAGKLHRWMLGADIANGEQLQVCMEAGWVFGARSIKGFSLVGCSVAPGFHFADFDLLERNKLLTEYPQYKQLIEDFTR